MQKKNNFEINNDFMAQWRQKTERDIKNERENSEKRRKKREEVMAYQQNQIAEKQARDKGMSKQEFDLNIVYLEEIAKEKEALKQKVAETNMTMTKNKWKEIPAYETYVVPTQKGGD